MALRQLGSQDGRVMDALLQARKDKDVKVRWAATYALGQLGTTDQRVVDDLLRALENKDRDVRREAARALGLLGIKDDQVVDKLLRAMWDEDREVRRQAICTLRKQILFALFFSLTRLKRYNLICAQIAVIAQLAQAREELTDDHYSCPHLGSRDRRSSQHHP